MQKFTMVWSGVEDPVLILLIITNIGSDAKHRFSVITNVFSQISLY